MCYAARSLDDDLRNRSSSGGVFGLLALETINNGGVVYGAAFDVRSQSVRHIRVDNIQNIDMLRGSKYVQSDISAAIFADLKSDVRQGVPVLFSGTPCQVAAIRSLLGDAIKGIILVDLVCHGVPSPTLFGKMLSEIKEGQNLDKIDTVTFRDKSKGWRNRELCIVSGGRNVVGVPSEIAYYGAFLDRLSIRKSCEDCMFNASRSGADITLGDFWGIEKVAPELDDNKGTSLVIINSEQGKKAFDRLRVEKKAIDIESATKANPSYWGKHRSNPRRSKFLALARIVTISRAYKETSKGFILFQLFAKVRRRLMSIVGRFPNNSGVGFLRCKSKRSV